MPERPGQFTGDFYSNMSGGATDADGYGGYDDKIKTEADNSAQLARQAVDSVRSGQSRDMGGGYPGPHRGGMGSSY